MKTNETLLQLISEILDDALAQDVITMELSQEGRFADYMVIASGGSRRHVGAIAQRLLTDLKARAGFNARAEGMAQSDWVLVDADDVVVHVFRPEVRAYYNLEDVWNEAKASDAQASEA